MESKYLAHIAEDGRQQTVKEHCCNTAKFACSTLEKVGMGNTAYFAGLLHDVGKYNSEFQAYLKGNGAKGSVIHTFQGVKIIMERFHHEGAPNYSDITCEILAYAAGAHHGLFDCIDMSKNSGFEHRILSDKISYEETKKNFLNECTDISELEALFNKADSEMIPVYGKLNKMAEKGSDDSDEKYYSSLHFYIGVLARLVLSSVIEGDRRDTAEFMAGKSFKCRTSDQKLWQASLGHVEKELDKFSSDTLIQKARRKISDECRGFAEMKTGIYRLNVPTGAGKTLSSLRFALAHAAKWEKSRIIFTAPLLTIIDQNAEIIREYIGNDDIILEHHSNAVCSQTNGESLDKKELIEENWNMPIIITSMFQLLNTFFDGRTSCIRRFQALCNSVIIIDEVQAIPDNMLSMFNLMLNFLSEICNVTFVLCSATQPAFDRAFYPLNVSIQEMVPYDEELWRIFKRTDIVDCKSRKLDEMPEFILDKLSAVNNMLVICNKKDEAEYIYRQLNGKGIFCLHLSAAMCQAHRRKVLERVKDILKENSEGKYKFVLVSTQVVEAGIDISFECVVRFLAGMDNVVQAAGRCNRNAESSFAEFVYLVNCSDENLRYLRCIQEGKTAAQELLTVYKDDPRKFKCDLASDESISYYYERLYKNMPFGYQDYTIKNQDTLLSMLSLNGRYADEDCQYAGKYFLQQAFKSAGEFFEVFDDKSEDVIVPYAEGKDLINELISTDKYDDLSMMKNWIERAKPYMVSIYAYQKDALGNGGIYEKNGVFILADGFYDPDIGFSKNSAVNLFMEV